MANVSVCAKCGSKNIDFIEGKSFDVCYCNECKTERECVDRHTETPFERTRNAVYATGNRWAIENFNATHY